MRSRSSEPSIALLMLDPSPKSPVLRPAELRREDDPVAPPVENLSEEALASSVVAVDLGRVEKRDPDLERSVDDRSSRREIDPAAEVVATEADARHAQAAFAEGTSSMHGET